MSKIRKAVLSVLGALTAVSIVAQLVMGQLILGGQVNLIKAHQHSGYTTVVLTLVYVVLSLIWMLGLPTRRGT